VTGNYFIDLLIPNNILNANSLFFSISGTQGGTTNTSNIGPTTATLFSATPWTSGQLDTYLGISGSPTNPIGAYLPSTQAVDSGATGFYVYQASLGQTQLRSQANALLGPLLTLNNALPTGSYILGFLNDGGRAVGATANSGAIFETGHATVPEPRYSLLIGVGLLAFVASRRMRVLSGKKA